VMRLRRLAVPAVVLAFVSAIAAVPGFAISKEFNQTYSLQPGGTFELQNVNGTVEVQGWDKDVVEVHAVKTAKVREADLERVSIDVDAKPNGVSILTRYPQNEGVEVAVEYTIHVPHGAKVEHLGTVNGTLRVAGVGEAEVAEQFIGRPVGQDDDVAGFEVKDHPVDARLPEEQPPGALHRPDGD